MKTESNNQFQLSKTVPTIEQLSKCWSENELINERFFRLHFARSFLLCLKTFLSLIIIPYGPSVLNRSAIWLKAISIL